MRDFLKKISRKIVVAIGVFAIAVSAFIGTNNLYKASASEADSLVVNDLRRDKNFSESDYPTLDSVSNVDDKLQLIALAESIDNELFAYFYCPLVNKEQIIAEKMSIRFSISGDTDYLKELVFLNAQSNVINRFNDVFNVSVFDRETVRELKRPRTVFCLLFL